MTLFKELLLFYFILLNIKLSKKINYVDENLLYFLSVKVVLGLCFGQAYMVLDGGRNQE